MTTMVRGLLIRLTPALSVIWFTAALPASYHLCVDVPSALGGTDYTPNQIVRSDAASYSLQAVFPAALSLGALHRRFSDDVWIFAPAQPVQLGGADYEPRDVVSYDGVTYLQILDGAAVRIPEGARIDAVLEDAAGDLVLSFDVPVHLGGDEYGPSDLVTVSGGGFSPFRDGRAEGIPDASNLVGAALDESGVLVVTFDVPTSLGGTDYLPGELVSWAFGGLFAAYFADPAWPAGSQLRDFEFAAVAAGEVPDGADVPGIPLTVRRSGASDLLLRWDASCVTSDSDFAVYQGTLGLFPSHAAILCSTGGATSTTVSPAAGSTYYLVVPRNTRREGSYGRDSAGNERSQGSGACAIRQRAVCP